MARNTVQGLMGEGFADAHRDFSPLPITMNGNVSKHFTLRLFGIAEPVNPAKNGNHRECKPKTRQAAAKLIRPAIVSLVKKVEKRAEEQKAALAGRKKRSPSPTVTKPPVKKNPQKKG